jgi:hypothetical protein
MDRTHAITRLNTEEIASEVNNVIKKGLDKLLGDHLYRYELLEKTHDAIMNLPSVRNHLNLQPLPQYNPETKVDDVNYSQMIEKLLKRIDELTFEVNLLKQARKNDCTDIKVEDDLIVVKLEQKENIRLEIEEEEESVLSKAESLEEDDESVLSKAESLEEEEAEEEEEEAEEEDEEESVLSKVESLEEDENICSECDCKVILDEDIVVVDGKNFCGACDPTSSKEEEAIEAEASEAEEEEVVEEVVQEAEEDDVETEKSEESASEEEAEEEFIEIDIDDVTYCTNNEENGFIYELTEDGDVGEKVGYLKDGEPFFYADEK